MLKVIYSDVYSNIILAIKEVPKIPIRERVTGERERGRKDRGEVGFTKPTGSHALSSYTVIQILVILSQLLFPFQYVLELWGIQTFQNYRIRVFREKKNVLGFDPPHCPHPCCPG